MTPALLPAVTLQTERYRANLAIAGSATSSEPWHLVTTLSRAVTAVYWYERRLRCEELYRDLKDQLHLETPRFQHAPRVERLFSGMVVLYCALTLIGAELQRRGLSRKVCMGQPRPPGSAELAPTPTAFR